MRRLFEDAGHLVRVALVFVAGAVLFAGVRGFVIPKSFGQYGHYRGDAVAENRARPLVHAGREACATCHEDIVQAKSAQRHAKIGCEACHGPLAKHAEDPSSKPQKPDTATLCARCHETNAAKPKSFPQVNTKVHAGDLACGSCHNAHQPSMTAGGQK